MAGRICAALAVLVTHADAFALSTQWVSIPTRCFSPMSATPRSSSSGRADSGGRTGRGRLDVGGRSGASGRPTGRRAEKAASLRRSPGTPTPRAVPEASSAPLTISPTAVEDGAWLFACRHTYEALLIEELARNRALGSSALPNSCEVLAPGLVCLKPGGLPSAASRRCGDGDAATLAATDLVFALQVLPSVVVCKGDSINALARAAVDALEAIEHAKDSSSSDRLDQAPRGALNVHALVPDSFRAAAAPAMQSRCDAVASRVSDALRPKYRAARPLPTAQPSSSSSSSRDAAASTPRLFLLQLLLLDPHTLVVSLAPCAAAAGCEVSDGRGRSAGRLNTAPLGLWPDWHRPAG